MASQKVVSPESPPESLLHRAFVCFTLRYAWNVFASNEKMIFRAYALKSRGFGGRAPNRATSRLNFAAEVDCMWTIRASVFIGSFLTIVTTVRVGVTHVEE